MARTKNAPLPGAAKAGSEKRAKHDSKKEAKISVKEGARQEPAGRVKAGRVTKSSDNPKAKSKEVAKQAVANHERHAGNASEKKKKRPPPPPEPESESDSSPSDEEMGTGSHSSESEADLADAKPAKLNGAAKAKKHDSESESESGSDKEAPKKVSAPTKVNGPSTSKSQPAQAETSSESESSDAEAGGALARGRTSTIKSIGGSKAAEGDSSHAQADAVEDRELAESESESASEADSESNGAEIPAKAGGAARSPAVNGDKKMAEASPGEDEDDEEGSAADESGAESDVEDSSESESDKEIATEKETTKKRKADPEATPVAKKSRTEVATPATNGDSEASVTVFVGGLSWNLDEEWLAREFEGVGEVAGCRIITDNSTGKSKGFGYVDFKTSEVAAKAVEMMNGAEIDGRNVRVDIQANKQGSKPQDRSSGRAQRFGDTKGQPNDTLFIGNLPFGATNEMISEEFGKYGTIVRVSLPTDRETGEPKGFGYVGYASVAEAQEAMKNMEGGSIGGRAIRLDYSTPRPTDGSSPARGGRGGGGGGFRGRGGRGGGDRGGRGGGFGRGGRGGRGGSTNRGGFGDFKGSKISF